jgi:glutamate dehydrogenase/leucine dehydrogenase
VNPAFKSQEEQLLLKTPFREMKVEVPVRMDDGSLRVFQGYRIQHSGARGPAKGVTTQTWTRTRSGRWLR